MADNVKEKINEFVKRKLYRFQKLPDSMSRAELAELRRGVGRAPGEKPMLWGTILTNLPEEFYGRNGEPSRAEWAIYIALTMFALHQQGHDIKTECMHADKMYFGKAVSQLSPMNDNSSEGLDSIHNRFNVIATSSDMRELSNHLRGMIKLLSRAGIPLDYASLAWDLYEYTSPATVSRVRLRWGQDFYRTTNNVKD